MKYEYDSKIYDTPQEVDEAIEKKHSSNFNNKETPQHVFEYDWLYEVYTINDKGELVEEKNNE
jgi:hypothetical protein